MTWTPLVSFFVLIVIFSVGNEISLKTHSVVSLVLVSSVIHLICYWTGIIPLDSVANTGMPAMLASFGLALMVTNLGTMMDLNQLLAEWKTLVICFSALLGLALMCFTIGTWIFGREYALVASVPISGGNVATTIIAEACEEAGREDLAGYAALVTTLQFLVGMPVAAYFMKSELAIMQKKGRFLSEERLHEGENPLFYIERVVLWKNAPEWWTRPYPTLARLTFIAVLSQIISQATPIPAAICWLILGIIGCQIGFLEKNTLQTGGFYGFLMIIQLSNIPKLLSVVTFENFKAMLIPVFGMLFLGAGSLAVFGTIVGKLIKVTWRTAVSVSLCAMFGYPMTMLIAEDAVATMEGTEKEKIVARGYALPKMLVGGFATVTIASVAFASILSPLIFR